MELLLFYIDNNLVFIQLLEKRKIRLKKIMESF